jgi:transposase
MGRAYSQDLRERVMAAVDSGTGSYAAASIFRVSVSYVYTFTRSRLEPVSANSRTRLPSPETEIGK